MKPVLKDQERLRHMLEAALTAQGFVTKKKRSDLDADTKLALALVRLLEVVGEAAHHVSDETKQRFPGIPWKEIEGTRNRLIHGYFDVDYDIVWQIVTGDLPSLIAALKKS